jgi:hypothetical protein
MMISTELLEKREDRLDTLQRKLEKAQSQAERQAILAEIKFWQAL